MNVKLLREIADAIEREPTMFAQENYGSGGMVVDGRMTCRTPACVAGWAFAIAPPLVIRPNEIVPDIHDAAKRSLELTEREATALFRAVWPRRWFRKAGLVPPPEIRSGVLPELWPACLVPAEAAVKILRMMADDGHVWTEEA